MYDSDALYDTIEVLAGIGTQRGVSPAQVALAYTLGKPSHLASSSARGPLTIWPTTWRPPS